MSTSSEDSAPPAGGPVTADPSPPPRESRLRTRLRILLGTKVFAELPSTELERIAAGSILRRVRTGENLTHHGDQVNSLIVCGRGRLKIVLPTPETGAEFLVGTFVEGDVIGEIGVFESMPRVGSHVATEDTEVVLVPKGELLALIERQPRVAVRLLEALSTKLRLAMELGLAFHSLDLPSRFYRRLLYFSRSDSQADASGDGLMLRHGLSQRDLADSIGVTREALNRLMTAWKQAGLIDYGRGFVLIRDSEALVQSLPLGARTSTLMKSSETAPVPARNAHGGTDPDPD